MKAIISVTGRDNVGITACVSALCSKYRANILDISQTVLQDYFAMIMLLDISDLSDDFAVFSDAMASEGERTGLKIHVMHEDIFNSMHRI